MFNQTSRPVACLKVGDDPKQCCFVPFWLVLIYIFNKEAKERRIERPKRRRLWSYPTLRQIVSWLVWLNRIMRPSCLTRRSGGSMALSFHLWRSPRSIFYLKTTRISNFFILKPLEFQIQFKTYNKQVWNLFHLTFKHFGNLIMQYSTFVNHATT